MKMISDNVIISDSIPINNRLGVKVIGILSLIMLETGDTLKSILSPFINYV